MPKKKDEPSFQSEAELNAALKKQEDELEAREEKDSTQEKKAKEKMVAMELPRLDNGRHVEIRVNGRLYRGRVEVPEHLAPVLREMADNVVRRERAIFVGIKNQGSGRGNRGMRRVGQV